MAGSDCSLMTVGLMVAGFLAMKPAGRTGKTLK